MSTDDKRLGSVNAADIVLVVALSISLLCNVFLGWRLKSLSAQSEVPVSSGPKTGMRFPELHLTEPSGTAVSLHLREDRSTIIYLFRPGCRWCAANIQNIRAFSKQASPAVDFVGISTVRTGLPEYLTENPLPFPVYAVKDASELTAVSFFGTPQTIWVSSTGVVDKNWSGAYGGDNGTSVESFFHVRLPGLVSVPDSK